MCETCGCSLPRQESDIHHYGQHDHVHGHGHAASSETIDVLKGLMSANDRAAAHNRAHFDRAALLAINLMSSPGAGKTRLDDFPGGNWFLPGILEDIPEAAPVYREELFAPVALLFRVPHLEAAIDLANDTPFGLGSAIFTQDRGEVLHAVRRLDAGSTAVNRIVASDPRLPFGGTKTSGYGRELAKDGMMAFVNKKTVTISGL